MTEEEEVSFVEASAIRVCWTVIRARSTLH
jgi:hypothetical protein